MYTHRRYPTSVRSPAGRYGDLPFPAQGQPGAGALRDLTVAPTAEIPLIVARYAALRAWILCHDRTRDACDAADHAALRRHALSAAIEQLDATTGEWPELGMLRDAMADPRATRAARLMESAATAAEALGHAHGARALRESVHRTRWRSLRLPPPSSS